MRHSTEGLLQEPLRHNFPGQSRGMQKASSHEWQSGRALHFMRWSWRITAGLLPLLFIFTAARYALFVTSNPRLPDSAAGFPTLNAQFRSLDGGTTKVVQTVLTKSARYGLRVADDSGRPSCICGVHPRSVAVVIARPTKMSEMKSLDAASSGSCGTQSEQESCKQGCGGSFVEAYSGQRSACDGTWKRWGRSPWLMGRQVTPDAHFERKSGDASGRGVEKAGHQR